MKLRQVYNNGKIVLAIESDAGIIDVAAEAARRDRKSVV